MKTQLIPLISIPDKTEFFCGTRLRLYRVGLRNASDEDNFYEYMLIAGGEQHMILANTTTGAGKHKAGYVICYVKMLKVEDRHVVTAEALKHSFGVENTFLVKEV